MRPEPWAINQALHFRQLIETFVEEAWVSRLDFARAERLDKSFVSEHYKVSEADIIYRGYDTEPDPPLGRRWDGRRRRIIHPVALTTSPARPATR